MAGGAGMRNGGASSTDDAYRSLGAITGLVSMIGVLSTASSGLTRSRAPLISSTVSRCSPSGFGRAGERVLNTVWAGLGEQAPTEEESLRVAAAERAAARAEKRAAGRAG